MTEAYTPFLDIGIMILLIFCSIILYKSWNARTKASDFYNNHVVAYKVGLIRKRSLENKVDLVFPPNTEGLIDEMTKEVDSDLEST